jgi:REP element-mobilizing transposase RayT
MSNSDDPAQNLAPPFRHPHAIQENGVPSNIPSAIWHSRGYLPHFESSEVAQHVTFHLADSLPQTVLQRLKSEPRAILDAKREAERRKHLEAWLDAGHGSCLLRNHGIAAIVQATLLAFDAQRYCLLAWVVMPNHVHVLFQPISGWTIAKIVASWKKFTARQIRDHQRQRGEPAADRSGTANTGTATFATNSTSRAQPTTFTPIP